MTTSSLTIRPPQSADELREHLDGYVEVAQSFSPDPLPKDKATGVAGEFMHSAPGYSGRCAGPARAL